MPRSVVLVGPADTLPTFPGPEWKVLKAAHPALDLLLQTSSPTHPSWQQAFRSYLRTNWLPLRGLAVVEDAPKPVFWCV